MKNIFELFAVITLGFYLYQPSTVSAIVPVLILFFIVLERNYIATIELKKPPKIDISHLEAEIAKIKETHKNFLLLAEETKKQSDETKKLMSQAQLALGFRRMPTEK